MVGYVFKRYELKYILDSAQYAAIKAEIEKRLSPDEFGRNTVQSLYYDTPDNRLIRASIEKPAFKEKLRVRCYNLNDDDKNVYVEMKRKYDGVVYKRRIACKEGEVAALIKGEKQAGGKNGVKSGAQTDKPQIGGRTPTDKPQAGGGTQTSQIGKELDYFTRFYGNLVPKILILCEREAFCDKESDLRVTFDENIRYRADDLNFYSSLDGENLLPDDCVLMELKSGSAFPLWLCRILGEQNIRKQSFSKYGSAYERELLKSKLRSNIICLNRFSATATSPQSVSLSS